MWWPTHSQLPETYRLHPRHIGLPGGEEAGKYEYLPSHRFFCDLRKVTYSILPWFLVWKMTLKALYEDTERYTGDRVFRYRWCLPDGEKHRRCFGCAYLGISSGAHWPAVKTQQPAELFVWCHCVHSWIFPWANVSHKSLAWDALNQQSPALQSGWTWAQRAGIQSFRSTAAHTALQHIAAAADTTGHLLPLFVLMLPRGLASWGSWGWGRGLKENKQFFFFYPGEK